MKTLVLSLALALMTLTSPALAVEPDEILADPALEARARKISRQIRCPVCQGESIDDSNARISKDLRIILRERLVAGDSDEEVIDFIVARYGEFVLFKPRATGANLALWLAGPLMLVVAGAGAFVFLRRRAAARLAPLSAEEERRLKELLEE